MRTSKRIKTLRYIYNLQSIFDVPEEKLRHAGWTRLRISHLHVTEKVKQKLDRHLNEYEGKFTVDQVGTCSVSSQHEHNHEDNKQMKMKSNEELTELLQTETTHIMKTNAQPLIQAKPILETSSRRGDPVDD